MPDDAGIQDIFRSRAEDQERTAAIADEAQRAVEDGRKVLVPTDRNGGNDAQRHRALVTALCCRHGARRLDLFGSATRDHFDTQHSDLDFLVEFKDFEPAQYAQAHYARKEWLEHLFERPKPLIKKPV